MLKRILSVSVCLLLLLSVLPAQAAELTSDREGARIWVPVSWACQSDKQDQASTTDLPKLFDDKATSFWYMIAWSSLFSDEIPELTLDFDHATLQGVWVRTGNQRSEEDYLNYARVTELLARVTTGDGTVTDCTLPLTDEWNPTLSLGKWENGYQLAEFPQVFRDVTRVELFIRHYRTGAMEKYYVCLSDLVFVSDTTARLCSASTGGTSAQDSATLTDTMMTWSGPGYGYDQLGSYSQSGGYVRPLSAVWSEAEQTWWVQVEFSRFNEKRRAYTPAAYVSVDPELLQGETLLGTGETSGRVRAKYGPSYAYSSHTPLLEKGISGDVWAIEGDYLLLDFFDETQNCQRRVWLPSDYVIFTPAAGE